MEKKSTDHKANCIVCGNELVYLDESEEMECYICKKNYLSNAECVNGHYICDKCHSLSAYELIINFCFNTKIEDPLELAIILIRNPQIKMHGPEHHFLVPAVLLTAYYNKIGDYEEKKKKIVEASRRAKNVLGGYCGFWGACGAGIGTGIFISLITNSTPLKVKEWKQSITMTSRSLQIIANHGGPRCCKRVSYLAIAEAVKYLKEEFDVNLSINENLKCEFNDLNKECLKYNCPFYNEKP
ncbi:MAG: DUF5714 domain-containing protein [Candidatus Helarchaeota archaeon]